MRGIAVGTVVIFHAWPQVLSGGYIGVDVFFVISGFLISSILLRDLDAGRFSIAEFYRRRVRRIFPALFVVLAATMIMGWMSLDPNAYKWLARTAVATLLFASNIDFYLTLNYFSPGGEHIPLLHTWSLAVEEQFYLVFPLLLWAVTRFERGRAHVFMLASGLCLALMLLSHWQTGVSAQAAYYLLPFRAFELLLGSMAAFAPPPSRLARHPHPRNALSLAGVLAILSAAILYTPETRFPGMSAAYPTLGAALVLYAGRAGPTWTGRLLSAKPLMFLGAISYSLYLWHWPLMAFPRIRDLSGNIAPLPMAGLLGLAVGLAWLTYRYIEQPALRRSHLRFGILKTGFAGSALAAALCLAIYLAGGVPARFSPEALRAFAATEDYSPLRRRCHRTDPRHLDYQTTCVLNDKNLAQVAVWGDSHGVEMAYALQQVLGEPPVREVTISACPPVINPTLTIRQGCLQANAKTLTQLEADPEIATVVLTLNRVAYRSEDPQAFRAGYETSVRGLIEAGKRPVLVGQVPVPNLAVPRLVGMSLARGQDPTRIHRPASEVKQESRDWDGFITDLAHRYHLDVILPPTGIYPSRGPCPALHATFLEAISRSSASAP